MQPARRFDFIKDGCVIVGDKDWRTVSGDVYQCSRMMSYWLEIWGNTYSPGWTHNRSSNFLFKDGHVQAYKYNGGRMFNDDYIPY